MDRSKFSAMPMKSLDPEDNEDENEIDDLLEDLKSHLNECKKLGKYVEAQMTQNRIAELKEKQSELRLAKFHRNQEKERNYLSTAYETEKAAAEKKWQEKLNEFNEKAQAEIEALQKRQKTEMENTRNEIESKIPEKGHISHEIVELKKREVNLATQGKFEDAHKVKMEVLAKEKVEQDAWLEERRIKVDKKLQPLLQKHANELNALQVTHENAQGLLEKAMNDELAVYFLLFYGIIEWKRNIRQAKQL